MAIVAAPQGFSFQQTDLFGRLESWNGRNARSFVVHRFLYRRGGIVEDFDQEPVKITVQLVFIGPDCASQYQKFKAQVADNPYGLLVHPIAGRFWAFCEGPNESENFSQATNRIAVQVGWTESQLDATVPVDVPDVGTQAQNVSALSAAMQLATATYMGIVAKANAVKGAVMTAVDLTVAGLNAVQDPIATMKSAVNSGIGVSSMIAGAMIAVAQSGEAFAGSIESYLGQATDIYNGSDTPAGNANATTNLLAAVMTATTTHEAVLVQYSPTPAGCSDAYAASEQAAAGCILLGQALAAEHPLLVRYLVTQTINVVLLAQQLYGINAGARAVEIMGLNKIATPGAIPAGTILQVYSS